MMRKLWLAVPAAGCIAAAACVAASAQPAGTPATIFACVSSTQQFTNVNTTAPPSCPAGSYGVSWAGTLAATPTTPSPTPTVPSPSPTPTASPTTTPSPTASPSPFPSGTACTVGLGSNCGAYLYPAIPMSNGFDTYVSNQSVGPQPGTSQTVTATDPGNWSVTASDVPLGYTGVQTFPDVQQLTNDWNGSGWGGSGSSDTPLASLTALKVNYSETSPQDANSIYEFAPDVWNDSYASDVMFWADTSPVRCTDNGMNAGSIIGQASLGGQAWTVYRNGGAGSEIIFILDGSASTDPVSTGTCARQASGTIDILAGFQWLASHGIMTSPGTLSQLNTGWEITSADNTTFTMNSYSISAVVA